MPSPLLDVRHLSISYRSPSGAVHAIRDVSLQIFEGESLALAGETGSGKSTFALSLLGLLNDEVQMESGEILFEGRSLRSLAEKDWREIRSRKIGMVFQDARSALNPILTACSHLTETLRAHQKVSKKAARSRAMDLLHEVEIPEAQRNSYPWELSGGMCQRVGIALGICNNPLLLIADEPTSAVDSTIQVQIIELLQTMKERYGLALLLISHDLPLISQIADRISILYHGRIVETGLAEEILTLPAHPYTQGLMQCQPRFGDHYETNPLTAIPGAIPDSGEDFPGCDFAPRCRISTPECNECVPSALALSQTHWVSCIRRSPGNIGN